MQKKLWWTALMTPLVITPIVIVASCGSGTSSNNDASNASNDKPNNDSNNSSNDKPNSDSNSGLNGSFLLRGNLIILDSLTEEQKETSQYVSDKTKLIKLILEKKDQIFETDGYYNLTDERQIEIIGSVQAYIDGDGNWNSKSGSLLFTIKVKAGVDPNVPVLINEEKVKLSGFGRFNTKDHNYRFMLESLSQEQKDATQYVNDKAKLIKLLSEKKDQIFDYPPIDLENWIEIEETWANIYDGSLRFVIKVKSSNQNTSFSITLSGFGWFRLKKDYAFNINLAFESLTQEQKDATQYVNDKAKLIKLILEKKDQIFETDGYYNLTDERQIEIIGNVKEDIEYGKLSFGIKVKAGVDTNASVLINEEKVKLSGFGWFRLKYSSSDSVLELKSLTEEQKETSQYVNDKAKLIKLILEKKDQIFETNGFYNLTDERQIEIIDDLNIIQNGNGSDNLSFAIKVKANVNPNTLVLINGKIKLGWFGRFGLKTRSLFELESLTEEQKDMILYGVKDERKLNLIRLILEKKNQIFNYPPVNLESIIDIDEGFLKKDIQSGSITFKIKINDFSKEISLGGFGKFGLKGNKRQFKLESLTEEQKDITKYNKYSKQRIVELILEKKDQIFEADNYYNLTDKKQIELDFINVYTQSGSITFVIEIKADTNHKSAFLLREEITLSGFSKK